MQTAHISPLQNYGGAQEVAHVRMTNEIAAWHLCEAEQAFNLM